MNILKKVLKEYLGVETVAQARSWANNQGCSSFRAAAFVDEVKDSLEGSPHCNWSDEEKIKDWIDSLRRAPYVGIGI